jgi:head-tail adaptor
MTAAGLRRERPMFQAKAVDENGDPTGAFEDRFFRWARIVPRTRGEVVLGQRVMGLQPAEVFIRADRETRAINSGWRMLWRGQVFNLKAVTGTEDRAEIQILAEADQTNG